MFLIAAYPELYKNYIFSRIPNYRIMLVSKVTARGLEIFFFYFLDFLSGFVTKNSNYLHTDRQ